MKGQITYFRISDEIIAKVIGKLSRLPLGVICYENNKFCYVRNEYLQFKLANNCFGAFLKTYIYFLRKFNHTLRLRKVLAL